MQRGKRAACFKSPASPNKDTISLEMWQMCCKCHLCLLPHVSQANYMVNVARLPMRQLWDRYNYARWRQQNGESTSSTVIIHMMDRIFASNNLMSTRVCISVEITGSNKTLKPSTSHDREPHTFNTAFYKHQTLKRNHNSVHKTDFTWLLHAGREGGAVNLIIWWCVWVWSVKFCQGVNMSYSLGSIN